MKKISFLVILIFANASVVHGKTMSDEIACFKQLEYAKVGTLDEKEALEKTKALYKTLLLIPTFAKRLPDALRKDIDREFSKYYPLEQGGYFDYSETGEFAFVTEEGIFVGKLPHPLPTKEGEEVKQDISFKDPLRNTTIYFSINHKSTGPGGYESVVLPGPLGGVTYKEVPVDDRITEETKDRAHLRLISSISHLANLAEEKNSPQTLFPQVTPAKRREVLSQVLNTCARVKGDKIKKAVADARAQLERAGKEVDDAKPPEDKSENENANGH